MFEPNRPFIDFRNANDFCDMLTAYLAVYGLPDESS
jgi:hypothetical protein